MSQHKISIQICVWCLELAKAPNEVRGVDIGPEQGNQRDGYRNQIFLCAVCAGHLLHGELPEFHARFRVSTELVRGS